MSDELRDLVDRARAASPNERIDLRDSIAAHGVAAVEAMGEWLADPALTRFAVRVIGKVGESRERGSALQALEEALEEATPDQRADIDTELRRLGVSAAPAAASSRRRSGDAPDRGVPAWMMRTDRFKANWLWGEVRAGRLRQGWGYQPKQELTLLRHRREQGEPMDRDDDWAWPNRRMLSDEPDGIQFGDLVLLPHLPVEWHWSIVRITGSYRYEIAAQHGDYGHILPAEIVAADLADDALTPELRAMRAYPARLRRLSRRAYEDLRRVAS